MGGTGGGGGGGGGAGAGGPPWPCRLLFCGGGPEGGGQGAEKGGLTFRLGPTPMVGMVGGSS